MALLSLGVLAGCVSAPRFPPSTPAALATVTRRLGDVTVHVVHTGWVRCKEAHRTLSGPSSLRLLSIATDRTWTEPMPMLVYVIEHPEGVFLVDAGLSEETRTRWPDDDRGNRFFYEHFLDFRFEPEQRIDRRLAGMGIAQERITAVVLSHRHADHSDAIAHLPEHAAVYVGARDWPMHMGARRSRWPRGRPPVLVGDDGPSLGAFPSSRPLTRDGRVAIIPLPGHSPGHIGLVVRTSEGDVVIGGDAAFSSEQVATRTLAGIVEETASAAQTLELLAAHTRAHRSFLLFAHDLAGLARFEDGEPTVVR